MGRISRGRSSSATHPAWVWLAVAACGLAAGACSAPLIQAPFEQGAAATATPQLIMPTAPPAPKTLVVCLAEEPNTFYLYGSPNAAARLLLPALYDGPFDVRDYEYQPVILERVPNLGDGSVRVEAVNVASGDLYFNPETMLPETLSPGKPFLPSGCSSLDCARKFEGGQAQLDRQIVEFHLLPGLLWSDGAPLTAKDSVFSFALNSAPETPGLKDQVYRTAAYEAVDDQTVRWTGIPGYFDSEVAADFWTPLPSHVLESVAPGDMPEAEAASRAPIGWGPYQLESWTPGQPMEFVPNANYFRKQEGLPAFDRVEARVVGGGTEAALQQVLTGECDVLDEALLGDSALPALRQLGDDARLRWSSTPGLLQERLDFDTAPAGERPPILANAETRRALAACIDRQDLIDKTVGDLSPLPRWLFSAEATHASDSAPVVYDPSAAAAALDHLGWVDQDGAPATPRLAQGAAGVPAGTPLSLTLLTTPGDAQEALARGVADDLARCGAAVEVSVVPAATLYAPWPDGPVFGRDFDLVLWPWAVWTTPACELFTSAEVASSSNPEGSNASGFADTAYDRACAQARLGLADETASAAALATARKILAEAVPALPLLQWPRLMVAGEGVCGLAVDPTADLLWNLEDLTPGPDCAAPPAGG
ncbi:MAG TPA: ABC transporter substrate-binding protein [Anaerolineales bacterium]|nr:ABC transporter substrate-binding protein [Anaerolineales bacterium]